jgi:hypothetical protein
LVEERRVVVVVVVVVVDAVGLRVRGRLKSVVAVDAVELQAGGPQRVAVDGIRLQAV